jgi:hypothetical protein
MQNFADGKQASKNVWKKEKKHPLRLFVSFEKNADPHCILPYSGFMCGNVTGLHVLDGIILTHHNALQRSKRECERTMHCQRAMIKRATIEMIYGQAWMN